MTPFLEGIILGITLAVLLGPALFALVQTSIHRGFRAGMRLAFGIFLAILPLCSLVLSVLCKLFPQAATASSLASLQVLS